MHLIGLFAAYVVQLANAQLWDYDTPGKDPSHWNETFPSCGGNRQSPIAIWPEDLVLYERSNDIGTLFITNTAKPLQPVKIENTGATVRLNIDQNVQVFGGPLEYSYSLMQIHFHWGPNETVGSEHMFADTHFPLEAHFVFRNEIIGADRIQTVDKGITVIAVFFRISEQPLPDDNSLSAVTSAIPKILYRDETTVLSSPIKLDDLLPVHRSSYFYYAGSLTTPPCSEVVEWIVFTEPLSVTRKQLDIFRSMHSNFANKTEKPLKFNFRPSQKLNGRKVLFIQKQAGSSSWAHFSGYLLFVLVAFALYFT